jgi:ribosomal-protein-alanine N-acetyltransferase
VETAVETAVDIRPLSIEDGEVFADLLTEDREFLTLWEPDEPDEYYTAQGQGEFIAAVLNACAAQVMQAWAIVGDGEVVGRIVLTGIILGPLRSCSVGYWVAQRHGGRGYGTAALRAVLDVAFGELALHRVDAFVRTDNERSCRMMERAGFQRSGISRGHLHAGGRWHDEVFFQKLAPWDDGVQLVPAPEAR